MTVYILRPTSVVYGSGNYAATGAASVLAAVNDASDSSYIRKAVGNTTNSYIRFGIPRPSLGAGEVIDHIAPVVRYKGTNGKLHSAVCWMNGTNSPEGMPTWYANSASAVNAAPGWAYLDLDDMADAAKTILLYYKGNESSTDGTRAYIYEVWAEARTITKPSVTPSNATMTSSAYAQVPLAITFAIDPWADNTQNAFTAIRTALIELQIESGGTGYGTGTVVATQKDAMEMDNGSNSVTITLRTPIANGSYKVYAKVSRSTTDHNGEAKWTDSGWSSAATLTMNAPLPAAPTITPFVSTNGIVLQVTPVATAGYTNPLITIERSMDNGVTWKTVRDANLVAGTFGNITAIYDREAGYGVATIYRARITATYSGVQNAGAWSANTAPASVVVTTWKLKVPENSTLNINDLNVVGDPTDELYDPVNVFRPNDRRGAVAVSGQLGGWDGTLEVRCNTEAEWLALKAILESQKVCLLESIFGGSKYVRLTKNAVVTTGAKTTPRRAVSLSYVETGAP